MYIFLSVTKWVGTVFNTTSNLLLCWRCICTTICRTLKRFLLLKKKCQQNFYITGLGFLYNLHLTKNSTVQITHQFGDSILYLTLCLLSHLNELILSLMKSLKSANKHKMNHTTTVTNADKKKMWPELNVIYERRFVYLLVYI